MAHNLRFANVQTFALFHVGFCSAGRSGDDASSHGSVESEDFTEVTAEAEQDPQPGAAVVPESLGAEARGAGGVEGELRLRQGFDLE